MDASEQGSNGIHAAEPFEEDSISSYLLEISDIYEESDILPRVGEQYQVEIPPVETKSKLFQLRSFSYDDAKMSASDRFGIGLAIPVNWIQYAGDNIKMKFEKEHTDGGDGHVMEGFAHSHKSRNTQVDSSDQNMLESSHVAHSANHNIRDNSQKNYGSFLLKRREAGDFYPLPGSPTFSLTEAEKQSFLLGLYIFGKNLVQVKQFMETKRMEDVLSFYYGKFYRSDAYRKWSECRKIRSRRSIHGQRIFTGWRQHELLSRILNTTPKELQDSLLEAAKTFNEGRATLEEFVFRLKAAVGLKVLVEAIGIGKGTYDLTVVALDQVRTNQTTLNPEIPVGRACSSLTSADIIKFLTGDFRLSKARSNDLFWEAVWPRLLARGWHSEQPKDRGHVSFKNVLVFLIPGVKKFSKKKLVKGTHFFDSVSDVLSQVASDPGLLEFDVEGEKDCGGTKEENGWDADMKASRNGSSNHQRHSYMHPWLPNCTSDRMKFTVVDTSLVQREGSYKVMEMRSLPSDSPASYIPSANSEESGGDSSSEAQDSTASSGDEEDSNHNSSHEKKLEVNRAAQSGLLKTSKPLPGRINGYAPGYKGLVKLKDEKTSEMRYHNSQRVKSGQTNYPAPPSKRRKLATCSQGYEDSHALVKSVRRKDSGPFQEKTNLYPHAKRKPENTNTILQSNPTEHKLQSQALIDLNNLPPDAYFTESTSNELKAEEISQSSVGKVSVQYYSDAAVDEQPSTGLRRQSTRNRPPTAKALEALASGFLGTKRPWRSANSSSRPPRKARKGYEELGSADVSSSALSMSAAETVDEDYEKVARKGTHDLLGVP